jgi:WD40 repeat protein
VSNADTGVLIKRFGQASEIAASRNGKWIVGSWFNAVEVRDANTYELRRRLYAPSTYSPGVAFAPDGKRLAAFSGSIEIWDLP